MVTRDCSGSVADPVHSGPSRAPPSQLVSGATTVAELVTAPLASMSSGGNGSSARTTRLMVRTPSTGRVGRTQTTVTPSADVQVGSSLDTKVRPAGSTSVMTGSVIGTMPVLVTVIV